MMVVAHLLRRDQFLGFSGSLGPSQVTMVYDDLFSGSAWKETTVLAALLALAGVREACTSSGEAVRESI